MQKKSHAHTGERVPAPEKQYLTVAGILFRLMSKEERWAVCWRTAMTLVRAPKEVRRRQLCNCAKADPAYGAGVAVALSFPVL